MKASKFTETQKAFILKQGEEGTSVAEICRKAIIGQPRRRHLSQRHCHRLNPISSRADRNQTFMH